jgi:tRNA threonylcarbamoyladenosine biosynthesis protein TsaE
VSVSGVVETRSAAQTAELGVGLAGCLEPGDVIVLAGDLGAGKTTLTQGVARGLGVDGPVVSPTFNLLVVHPGRLTLNHLDLYRLTREEELEDIDFHGTLESGGVSLIEWGDRFPRALPADRLEISLHVEGADRRSIRVEGHGARSARLATEWLVSAGADERAGGAAPEPAP